MEGDRSAAAHSIMPGSGGSLSFSEARTDKKSKMRRVGSALSTSSLRSNLSASTRSGGGKAKGRQLQTRQSVAFRYQSLDRNAPYFVAPRVLQVRLQNPPCRLRDPPVPFVKIH